MAEDKNEGRVLSAAVLWSRLDALRPFFAEPATSPPAAVEEMLRSVLDFQEILWRSDRQVTFFGALKAGKSSLINTLIGAPLLPVRAQRATGAVTVMRYGAQPSATIVRGGGAGPAEEEIHFDDVAQVILGVVSNRHAIQEVRISVPLPLLETRCVLVDTPGLLENETLTERSFREIERTDLAIMVLSADKILSRHERDAAMRVDELLNGSVVYVVNRLDMVEEDDRQEVLDWTRTALRDSGNRFVGQPRIFATAASGTNSGPAEFRGWLADLLTSEESDMTAACARLGILEHHLSRLEVVIRAGLAEAQGAAIEIRNKEAAAHEREKAEMRIRLAHGRAQLQACRDRLPAIGEAFVVACVAGTGRQTRKTGSSRETVRLSIDSALHAYAEQVAAETHAAAEGLPVSGRPFSARDWIVRADVQAVTHPTSEIGAAVGDLMTRLVDGGVAGREAGATIGGWIGRSVFGVDPEQETLKRVERFARSLLLSLQTEAERHIETVDAQLMEAVRAYDDPPPASRRLIAAEEKERHYRDLLQWCERFLHEVGDITSELRPISG